MDPDGTERPTPADGLSAEAVTLHDPLQDVAEVAEDQRLPGRGQRILGRYIVIGEAGRGGMGTVTRAYDPKLHREVALKRVLSGEDDDDASARLVREAQLMAQLSHPNVVAVYDVATVDREVIIVMEFVAGQTLREWLGGRRTRTEVIDALRQAGTGLAAAHRAGLVHRDFKPANALIEPDGRVKVTDFGLAGPVRHAADTTPTPHSSRSSDAMDRAPVATLHTALAHAGTPRYMAPEQHDGLAATTASDQYALCVSLWSALTGTPPFLGKDLAAAKRAGPPAWPTDSDVPSAIVQTIRRGLSPDPNERFANMEALLDGLSEPHPRRGLAAFLAVGVVSAGVVGVAMARPQSAPCEGSEAAIRSAWNSSTRDAVGRALRASATGYADETARRAVEALDRYADRWATAHYEACASTTIRGDRSQTALDRRMDCLERHRVELTSTIGVLTNADTVVLERAVQTVSALSRPEDCLDAAFLVQNVAPPDTPELAAEVDALDTEAAEIRALRIAGKFADADALIDEVVRRARATEYEPLIGRALTVDGNIAIDLEEYDRAALRLREAYDHFLASGDDTAAAEQATSLIAVHAMARNNEEARTWVEHARAFKRRIGREQLETAILENTAYLQFREHRYREAIATGEAALARLSNGDDRAQLRITMSLDTIAKAQLSLGDNEAARKRLSEVLEIRERLLGSFHPFVAASLANLGAAHFEAGDITSSTEVLRRALEITRANVPDNHPSLVDLYSNLGMVLLLGGEFEAARETLERAVSIGDNGTGPAAPIMRGTWTNLSGLYSQTGEFEAAVEAARKANDLARDTLAEDDFDRFATRFNYAGALSTAGRRQEAIEIFEQCAKRVDDIRAPPRGLAAMWASYAQTLLDVGELDRAQAAATTAVRILEETYGDSYAGSVTALKILGRTKLAQGEADSAVETLARAVALPQRGQSEPNRAGLHFALAEAITAANGDTARARAEAEIALKAVEGLAHRADDRDHYRAWLAAHPARGG